jgi:hypothetical protein
MLTDDQLHKMLEVLPEDSDSGLYMVEVDYLTEIITRLLSTEARVKVLEDALRAIAVNATYDEAEGFDTDPDELDWAYAFELCVNNARNALQEQSK